MYRSIDTEVWNDGWFQEELNRDQKLLFLFLITNQRTTTTGAFEITLSSLSTETGIPRDELSGLLASLSPKIVWWPEHRIVWVRNFHRRQFPNANEKIITNARSVLARMPAEVVDTVCAEYPDMTDPTAPQTIPPAYPMDTLDLPASIEEVEIQGSRETEIARARETVEAVVPRSHAATAPAVDDGSLELVVETLIAATWVNDDEDGVRRGVLRSYQLVPDFDTRDGPYEAAQHVAYFTTGKGKKSQPTDWTASFRNWLKRAVEHERRDNANGSHPTHTGRTGGGVGGVVQRSEPDDIERRGYSYDVAAGIRAAG